MRTKKAIEEEIRSDAFWGEFLREGPCVVHFATIAKKEVCRYGVLRCDSEVDYKKGTVTVNPFTASVNRWNYCRISPITEAVVEDYTVKQLVDMQFAYELSLEGME